MRSLILSFGIFATLGIGGFLALDVLFWLGANLSGVALDGPDRSRPGHLVCLNPPYAALILPGLAAAGLLEASRRLFLLRREEMRREAAEKAARWDLEAVFSRWD